MPESRIALTAPEEDLALITEAAREGGRIAMGFFGTEHEVWWKGGRSPVTKADLAVDRFLHDRLREARPDYGWLSEETLASPERLSAARSFVVDPIDGTRAFMGGRSRWCVSIAVVEHGKTIAGVLDCPALDEIYTASTGNGAAMDGKSITVREPGRELHIAGPKPMLAALPDRLSSRVVAHGYVPSLAYRIAMVARGALDATFVKANSHDWDIAAADLILREAGGLIVDPQRRPPLYAGPSPSHGILVAGSAPLMDEMVTALAGFNS